MGSLRGRVDCFNRCDRDLKNNTEPLRSRVVLVRVSADLTERERSIIGLIADGETAKLIAKRLSLSPRVVERDIEACRRKLSVRNNAQLVASAAKHGCLTVRQD